MGLANGGFFFPIRDTAAQRMRQCLAQANHHTKQALESKTEFADLRRRISAAALANAIGYASVDPSKIYTTPYISEPCRRATAVATP